MDMPPASQKNAGGVPGDMDDTLLIDLSEEEAEFLDFMLNFRYEDEPGQEGSTSVPSSKTAEAPLSFGYQCPFPRSTRPAFAMCPLTSRSRWSYGLKSEGMLKLSLIMGRRYITDTMTMGPGTRRFNTIFNRDQIPGNEARQSDSPNFYNLPRASVGMIHDDNPRFRIFAEGKLQRLRILTGTARRRHFTGQAVPGRRRPGISTRSWDAAIG